MSGSSKFAIAVEAAPGLKEMAILGHALRLVRGDMGRKVPKLDTVVLDAPATVRVYDRLPVVDDEVRDLDVTLLSSEPALTRSDEDPRGDRLDGGVRWRVPIGPRADARVEYSYRVTFPAKAELVGGNRRE